MENRTAVPTTERKMPGWVHTPNCACVHCDADRALAALAAADDAAVPTTAERLAAEDAAYDDRVPAKASAIWAFVTACENVAGALVFESDCETCHGAGCARCDGIGFTVPAEWAKVLQAVLVAVSGLCTDAGHPLGCHCGGELAGGELAPVAA